MEKSKEDILKERIKNGYLWMEANPNSSHYAEALTLYESLVDEAEKLGIKEKDCWPPTVDEAVEIFVPKQEKLLTDGS